MPEQTFLKQQFNGGAISPWGGARQDVPGVMTGANKMTNFLAKSFGPAYKRAGTEFITSTKNNGVARLQGFNYDAETKYMIEFGAGYTRFQNDGVPITINAIPTTWDGTRFNYNGGDIRIDSARNLQVAKSTHEALSGTEPPSVYWNQLGIKQYAANTLFTAGELVFGVKATNPLTGASAYYFAYCKTTHTSGATFDSPDLTKFTLLTQRHNYNGWVAGPAYAIGDYVTNTVTGSVRFFRCKLAHTAAAANQPGVGASWTTNWTEYSTIPLHSTASVAYLAGDMVKFGTDLYFATSNHTSSASNEPTDSGAPWVKMAGVKPWAGTGIAIAVGETYYYNGAVWSCFTAHTSGAYLSDTNFGGGFGPNASILVDSWAGVRAYNVGNVVLVSGGTSLYVCIKKHDTGTTTVPTSEIGKDYWQKLSNISVRQASTAYNKGQYLYSDFDGLIYLVLVNHTSSLISTPSVDAAAGKIVNTLGIYLYEIENSFTANDLFEIGFLQLSDVVWVMNKGTPTKLLTRCSATVWSFAEPPWDFPPLLDENVDEDHTIFLASTTGESVLAESSKKMFVAGHVGAYFQLGHNQSTAYAKKVLSANGSSTSFKMSGRLDIYIYGTTWVGDVVLEYSYNNVNWYPRRSWTQPVANLRTVATNTTFEEEVWVRVTMANRTAGGASDYAWIEAADSRVNGMVKVLSVESPTRATVRVLDEIASTAPTALWAEGAFSSYRGYARCGTVHEARVVLAGGDEPQRFYMSGSDDFYNFLPGTSETASISFDIASKDSNSIQWMESLSRVMAIGTLGEVWSVSRSSESKIISAVNPPSINRESNVGSYSNSAVLLADSAMFVRSDGLALQRFAYMFDQSKWGTSDISEVSEHLLKSGVKQLAVMRQPDTILFGITNDGRLLTMVYNAQQSVVAWSEHTTEGTFESVAVTYGGRDSADEVSLVVKRNINGTDVRYIEQFHPATMKLKFDGDEKELCYLDCSKLKNGTSSVTVTGLTHLVNEEVYALADGIVRGPFTVSGGGELTLPVAATKVRVGKIFTSELQGVRLEDAEATIQGNNQMLNRVVIRTYQSNGFELSSNPEDSSIPWSNGCGGNISDVAQRSLVITDHRETIDRRTDDAIKLTIRSSKPLPVCILAIIYKLDVTEV
jgi:hypothetical protein